MYELNLQVLQGKKREINKPQVREGSAEAAPGSSKHPDALVLPPPLGETRLPAVRPLPSGPGLRGRFPPQLVLHELCHLFGDGGERPQPRVLPTAPGASQPGGWGLLMSGVPPPPTRRPDAPGGDWSPGTWLWAGSQQRRERLQVPCSPQFNHLFVFPFAVEIFSLKPFKLCDLAFPPPALL